MQRVAFAAQQLNDCQANRVGAARRAGGKKAVGAIVGGRRDGQVEAVRAVEDPQNVEMRVAFDVGEAWGKGGQDVERAFLRVLCARAFGNLPLESADLGRATALLETRQGAWDLKTSASADAVASDSE